MFRLNVEMQIERRTTKIIFKSVTLIYHIHICLPKMKLYLYLGVLLKFYIRQEG